MNLKAYRYPFTLWYDIRYPKEYRAGLRAVRDGNGCIEWGYLDIAFATNPRGLNKSMFNVKILASDFEALAKEMMKADPHAAIKAFAVAINEAKITVQPDYGAETKAA